MKLLLSTLIALMTAGPALAQSLDPSHITRDLNDRGLLVSMLPFSMEEIGNTGMQLRLKILGSLNSEFALGVHTAAPHHEDSSRWRFVFDAAGDPEQTALILEEQTHLEPRRYVGLDKGLGFIKKADDVAPVIGFAFSF